MRVADGKVYKTQVADGLGSEEVTCLCRATDGEAQQDGDDVDEWTLGSVGQTTGFTTLSMMFRWCKTNTPIM